MNFKPPTCYVGKLQNLQKSHMKTSGSWKLLSTKIPELGKIVLEELQAADLDFLMVDLINALIVSVKMHYYKQIEGEYLEA